MKFPVLFSHSFSPVHPCDAFQLKRFDSFGDVTVRSNTLILDYNLSSSSSRQQLSADIFKYVCSVSEAPLKAVWSLSYLSPLIVRRSTNESTFVLQNRFVIVLWYSKKVTIRPNSFDYLSYTPTINLQQQFDPFNDVLSSPSDPSLFTPLWYRSECIPLKYVCNFEVSLFHNFKSNYLKSMILALSERRENDRSYFVKLFPHWSVTNDSNFFHVFQRASKVPDPFEVHLKERKGASELLKNSLLRGYKAISLFSIMCFLFWFKFF